MQIDHQRAALRYQNKVNNAQGHFFRAGHKKPRARCMRPAGGRRRQNP